MPAPAESVVLVANGARWGGTERHVLDLCRGLAERRVRTRVILGWEALPAERFRRMQLPVEIVSREGNPIAYLDRMTRSLSSRRPAVAHLHGGGLPSLAARRAGVPIVIETRHGLGWPEARRRSNILRRLRERAIARCLDATIAVCRLDADTLSSFGRRNVHHIPNGIRLDDPPAGPEGTSPRPEENHEEIRMGFIGRLTSQKGLATLLRALTHEERPFRLEVAGSGPLETQLRSEAESLGLADRVHFHGLVEDAARRIPQWDLLVLPSIWEGCPYSVLESLACRRPVLGTRVGGMEELVADGQWGWLADPGDVSSLRGALARVSWDRAELRRMGEEGRKHIVAHYGLERMVAGIMGVYAQLGQRKGVHLGFQATREMSS